MLLLGGRLARRLGLAGWLGLRRRSHVRMSRNTCYVDPLAKKCYRNKPELVAALTAEASA